MKLLKIDINNQAIKDIKKKFNSEKELERLRKDEYVDKLNIEIDDIKKHLKELNSSESIVLKLSLSVISGFISGYGIYALSTIANLGKIAATLAFTNPIGFACGSGIAVIVGGVTLCTIIIEKRKINKAISSLTKQLIDYQDRVNERITEYNAKLLQLKENFEARISALEKNTVSIEMYDELDKKICCSECNIKNKNHAILPCKHVFCKDCCDKMIGAQFVKDKKIYTKTISIKISIWQNVSL